MIMRKESNSGSIYPALAAIAFAMDTIAIPPKIPNKNPAPNSKRIVAGKQTVWQTEEPILTKQIQ